MAKKVIAGLKKATEVVKVVKPVKNAKTGKYRYKVDFVAKDNLEEFLKKGSL